LRRGRGRAKAVVAVSEPFFWRAGIDENGLGPKLGPLVVTGVLARAGGARRPGLRGLERLGDSKRLMAHQDVALGEAWARLLVPSAATPAGVVAALSVDSSEALRAPCPAGLAAQCWPEGGRFEAPGELVEAVRGDLERLRARGLEPVEARCVVLCPKRLHAERALGRTLFDIDLHAMERLALALRARAGADLEAVCGKVGGIHAYGPRFGPLAGRAREAEEEGRARSAYRVAGLGRVAFVRDADGADPLVALASMVGKYVREVLMGTIVSFYRRLDPALPDASGYRDPVTGRFVLATEALRRGAGVADECFLRP
jgi:ribonuclease HII